MKLMRIGVDLAKNVFQIHGTKRGQIYLMDLFNNRPRRYFIRVASQVCLALDEIFAGQ
jgi:hypothetical protein